ncbi:unnamed protein product [Rotaria magnacalcarata]|uniref:C2 domain-containing protein n=1 Tax=Rotaria magnacalcarata TaxID=392030 RepID=A0A815ESI6_9BILA|nr:unnamed protein product [Rotaria magnacalcarata]CAF1464601.1 unnamed protein product [Rotaria magnacalcarata]
MYIYLDSCTKLSTISNSKSNNSIHESSSTLTAKEPIQTEESINDGTQSTNNAYRYSKTNNNKPTKGETFGSVGNLGTIDSNDDDDDDDIDGKFEKAKLGLGNRTTSCMDIRGSQASINSTFSEKKARYGLDISGTIELKLTYTLTTGALDVTIQKCSNLAKAKRGQSSDPYVKLYLLPDRSKNGKRRTLTKKNTVDPVYDQKFRYHVTKQEFETRVLWISVWSESILGLNDFLGEINLPLTGCTLDKSEEHSLLAQKKKTDLKPILEPTLGPAEITFQITFIENPRNKDIGTLQIHYIQAKAIFFGKNSPDVFCKGLLMPDKVKKKIAGTRKGPAPKWDVPLRWDGVRCDNLENTSIEISVWCQESFRKTMFGFVRLNLSTGHFSNKPVEWLDATRFEKAAWERFIARPTMPHTITLPLRPPTARSK